MHHCAVTGQELFFAVSYRELALVKIVVIVFTVIFIESDIYLENTQPLLIDLFFASSACTSLPYFNEQGETFLSMQLHLFHPAPVLLV